MATSYSVTFTSTGDLPSPMVSGLRNGSAAKLGHLFRKISAGELPCTLTGRMATTQASGTLTLSSASGTVGGVINGVTVTVTASGGDTATATAIAAAINASSNALVKNLVTASAAGAVVTITATPAGIPGNTMTLAASGTGVTASGSRLSGGADTLVSLSY